MAGVAAWGLSGVLAAFIGKADVNASTTIHNLCAWLAALMHLVGVVFLSRQFLVQRERGLGVLLTVTGVLTVIALIVMATVSGWLPEFFVQGKGGTAVRHVVLGSAILMFLLSTFAFRKNK